MQSLRIDQKWNMFAPKPPSISGWYRIPGKLRNGKDIDVWRKVIGPASTEKPALVSATYLHQRWRKYLMNLFQKRHAKQRLHFGRYLCRRWNTAGRTKALQLVNFKIYFMSQKIINASSLGGVEPILLWSHSCFKKSESA